MDISMEAGQQSQTRKSNSKFWSLVADSIGWILGIIAAVGVIVLGFGTPLLLGFIVGQTLVLWLALVLGGAALVGMCFCGFKSVDGFFDTWVWLVPAGLLALFGSVAVAVALSNHQGFVDMVKAFFSMFAR